MRDLSAEASPPSPRAMAAGGEGGCVTREERSTTEAQRARRNTENSTPNALVPMLRGLPDGAQSHPFRDPGFPLASSCGILCALEGNAR